MQKGDRQGRAQVTNEQKRDLALKGKEVLVHLRHALVKLNEIDVLMVEKAAAGLITDAAVMISNEIKTRCAP